MYNVNPLQCSCLENPHGQRNLVGYSPWGRKESDTTERLHFHCINVCSCRQDRELIEGKCDECGIAPIAQMELETTHHA